MELEEGNNDKLDKIAMQKWGEYVKQRDLIEGLPGMFGGRLFKKGIKI